MDRPLAGPRTASSPGPEATRPRGLRGRAWAQEAAELLFPLAALGVILGLWEAWTRLAALPVYLLPPPSLVLGRLAGRLGFFATEGLITLYGALAGLALGGGVALSAAVIMAHSPFLERSLFPLAILAKVTPIVAVAPLFTIWFGFNDLPRILITALMVFFPLLVNGIVGFRSVEPGALDFLRSLHAAPWEVFVKLRLPSALPYLLAGLKVSTTLALIGAVVAEWLGADRGLGRVILLANSNLDTPTLFAGILLLSLMGIGLMALLTLVERRFLFWHASVLSE